MVGQTKDQGNTVYVIRDQRGDEDESDVELTVEIPPFVGKISEGIGKAEIDDLADDIVKKVKSWDTHAEDIVEKVKSSETQTPITKNDPDDIDDRDSDGDSEESVKYENLTEIEIDNMITKNALKNKRPYKERMKWVDAPKKKLYACQYCNKLFGRTSDCTRHEQTCLKSKEKEAFVEISAKEIQVGKLQISEKKVKSGEGGVEENRTDAKTWAEILNDALDVDIPANISNPSLKGIYHCPLCPKKLKGSSNFYSHYRAVHENYRPFTCDVCKQQFGTRNNFTNHQIAVHTRKCDGCGSYVAETEPWAEGISKHNERNILCGSCNKVVVFVSGKKILPAGMAKVKSAITSYKPRNRKTAEKQTYACEVCDKLFSKLFDCRRHQQKHAAGKLNMCDVCGRQFQHATSLQQHQKIHDDSFIPPHCSICNKDFQLRKSFVEHMIRKHGIHVSEDKNSLETIEAGVLYGVAKSETIDAFGNTVIQM